EDVFLRRQHGAYGPRRWAFPNDRGEVAHSRKFLCPGRLRIVEPDSRSNDEVSDRSRRDDLARTGQFGNAGRYMNRDSSDFVTVNLALSRMKTDTELDLEPLDGC